jgi:hypothetical protein
MTIFSYTIMVAIYNIINYLFASSILLPFFEMCVKPVTFKLITQISYITIVKLNSDFAQA